MCERVQTLSDELLNAVQHKGAVELVGDYALPLAVIIIAEMLGIPPDDWRRFQRWSSSIVAVASRRDALLAIPHIWAFMHYLRKLFEQRRADPRDDLTTALVEAEDAGTTLSEDELLAMVVLLLVAGHETSANLIASGTLALLQHPDQMERLKHNPSLIKLAVEELLRYTSPLDMATERFAREDVMIAGTTIPRGEMVLAVIGSANRDEQQFENPDILDLTREPNRHLAFGLGVHYCLGAPLARLEGQIAIHTLLRWRRGLFLRGLEQLPLAF